MFRMLSLVVSTSLLSFAVNADCISCKPSPVSQESLSPNLVEKNISYYLDNSIVLGQKGAKHSVVFFTDAECSFCHQAYQNLKELRLKWKDDVNIVIKQSPLTHHQKGNEIARFSLALRNQSEKLAAEFTEYLYENPESIRADQNHWIEVVKSFDVDTDQLQTDLASPALEKKLLAELGFAKVIGLKATPSFVIGGELITGSRSIAELENLIFDKNINI
jgi:protein-disulfide isomerase